MRCISALLTGSSAYLMQDHTGSAGADMSGEGAEAGLGQSSSEHGFGEDSEEPARRDCRQRAPEPLEQD